MDTGDLPPNVIPLFTRASGDGRQQMIETWEALHLRHGLTLTDDRIAESLRVAVDMMTLLLKGAQINGLIDEEQLNALLSFVQTGRAAADWWQD
ncbi:hypothetical protein [Streptomyces sp. NPDC059994]|uniref:hypothetical protein n=1 Tax=Streptomyces sp. NPDC059994 TaxID=3347029 RepID=UPI0036A72397